MKRSIFTLVILGLIILGGFYAKQKFYGHNHQPAAAKSEAKKLAGKDDIRDGDLIFQETVSGQSKAIQLATKSIYTHCGIIYKQNGKYYVFEAIQPVKSTPLAKWIARGKNGHYVIKRLKNADKVLTAEALGRMKCEGEKFIGKNYDLTFEWSDKKIYCSELIWKVYQRATGIEIGKLKKYSDFDLSSEVVRKKIKERYGGKIPMDEIAISPGEIFNSDLLVTVKQNS